MNNLDKINNIVDRIDPDKVMNIMKQFIGINTSVPPGNKYREYVDAISPYLAELGYSLEEVVVPEVLVKEIDYPLKGPRINLVASKDFGQQDWVTFYGHMDVVPAAEENEKKWRFPPFEATMIKSGKIYGRGVSDMKGAMVCLILALQIIEELGLTPNYNVRVMNCTDEEIGVWPGIRYLEQQGYVKGCVFCMEGVINPIIPVGSAGALNVFIETVGRSCHSGMNFLGVNALEEMVPIMVELIKLKKIVEMRESKDIPGFPRIGTGEKRNMTPMFNLDVIRAGEKSNIVPGICRLTVNRRLIPEEDIEEVKSEIAAAIKKGQERSKALELNTQFVYDYPALRIDPNSSASQKIKKVMSVVQNVSEEDFILIGSSGSTDMGFLSDYDIIIHGVSNPGSNSHGVNETIKLRDVKTYIKELIAFLCEDI
ncbi:MAG: ArgE/DapE family deacylase [Candidatus Lokiarchaeota archaeon]|nr:ArgE/DapE family deacylase [Candidatus Lokiarchaeota archaeon]MBD3338198.1 ArgE/DapE family deacylase [Candidatus Lokiarchaeota archaeon]